MQNDNDRKWLYDKLKNNKYNVGSYDEFSKSLTNEEDRKWYYDKANAMKLNVGSYEEFNQLFGEQGQLDSVPAHLQRPQDDSSLVVVPGTSSPMVQPRNGQSVVGVTEEQPAVGGNTGMPLPAWQQEGTIKGFVPAFKQGWDGLYQGQKSAVGEMAGLLTGSQRDYAKATSLLDELVDSRYNLTEFDAEKALKDYKDREYQRKMSDWEKAMEQRRKEREGKGFFDSLVHRFKDPSRPLDQYDGSATAFANLKVGDEVQLRRAYLAIQDALKETGGDVEKAYSLLGRNAEKETWGDKTAREAREALAEHKPTEGVAAWVGNLVPQMVGNVAAIAASTNPYTRWMARPLGMANMAALTASSAGSSMADARTYAEETGQAVSEGDVLRAGGVSAAIEAGTEMIPYGRYFSGVQNYTKKKLGKFIGETVADNPQAKKEIGTLLERAQKELGGNLFAGKGVKEYLKDVGYEGFSEFLAEGGGALVPMIYQRPEDYPTLSEVLHNGWEGAKGGMFMGVFLGAGSRTVGHYANKSRREKQGKVVLAETEDGVIEIVGENEKGNGYSAMNSEGELVELPKDVVKDMITVGYDEFYNHVSEKVNDDVEVSREEGYSLATPQEQNDAKNLLELSAADVKTSLGYSNDDELESFVKSQPSASALLMSMSESGYDQESIDAVADYVNAKARYEGLIQQVRDGIDGKIGESNRFIDEMTHEDKMLHPATMKQDDRQVYVTAGKIVMTEDGSGIDHQKSDGSIVVCDALTGKLEMVDPGQIFSLQAVSDAVIEKQAVADRIRQEEARQAADRIEGVVPMQQGDTYAIVDESGTPAQIQVVQNNGDGRVIVTTDGSTTVEYSTEQLQQMVDVANKVRLQEERGRKKEAVAPQETPASVEVGETTEGGEATEAAETTKVVQEQETEETPEQKLRKVVEALPKKKDGGIDYKALTPEQRYEYTSLVESPEVAIEDLSGDVAVKQEELTKLNDRLSKVVGGDKTELRDLIRSKKQELEVLDAFYQRVVPKQETVQTEESGAALVPEGVRNDEDYIGWVADNSDDAKEILGAYSAAKELASHEQKLKPWQQELLGRKINTSSFTRFGDRNHITGALAKGWLRKDGYEIDTLAQELSENGVEVTEQDIVDFMLSNPSNHVSQVSDVMRLLSSKFSEIATKEMGIPVSGPESNTGKLYIRLKEANHKLNELSEQQRIDVQSALSADMITDDVQRADSYYEALGDYLGLYDQYRDELGEDAADEVVMQEVEAAEPELYYGGFTADELDEIYSKIENNNGTEGQAEDSGENQSSLFGEEIEGNEESGAQEIVGIQDREVEGEDSGAKPLGEVEQAIVGEEPFISEIISGEIGGEGNVVPVVKTEALPEKASVQFVPPQLMPEESLLDYSDRIVEAKRVFDAGREVNAHPTDAQKKAGNYKKGHVKVDGYDITIENPKGSVRSGVDVNGAPWEVTMNNTYGYIRGTEGVDGDHIDVFLSDDPANSNGQVYVVDQVDETGAFDEHKVMYGFTSEEDARAAYLANYSPGWKGLGSITGVSKDVFDGWLHSSHRKTKAFSDYKMIKERAGEKVENSGQEQLLSENDSIVAENANISSQNVDMSDNSQQDGVGAGQVEEIKKKRPSGKKSGESSLSLFDNDLLNQSESGQDNNGGTVSTRQGKDEGQNERVGGKEKGKSKNRELYGSERRSEEADSRLGETQREEIEGVQGRLRMDRSRPGDIRPDEGRSGRLSDVPATESRRDVESSEKKNQRNNRNERGKDYAPASPKARFDANIAAIRLMHELTERARTPKTAQMQVLRRYSGWGGLGTFFNNEHTTEGQMLRELLGEEEYEAAAMSINSAYYTPASVTDSLWDAVEKLGFKGGTILEGSAGIGNILGAMPEGISERSAIEAVEIDGVSGNILKLLYPDAKVHVQGFQDTNIKNGSVDLAITNVPFVTGLHVYDKVDKDLSRKFKNIHDFCIAKNIRKLREGGIGIFITSNGTLDKSRTLREWIIGQGKADVVGAFRLNNETFGGTNATSDIIIVQKRIGNQPSTHAIDVLNTSVVRTGEYETGDSRWDKKLGRNVKVTKPVVMEYNSYFVQHPENMAGEMAFAYEKGDTFRPGSVGLYPGKGQNQQKMLQQWIEGMPSIVGERMELGSEPQARRMETTEKEGTLLLNKDGELCVSQRGEAVPVGVNKNKVKGSEKRECLSDYNAIKTALDEVLQYQVANEEDGRLKPLLKELNRAYDNFVAKYGPLNRNTSISFLKNDVDFPSISALEDYRETKSIGGEKSVSVTKTNVFNGRVIGYKAEPAPTTVKDGVIASVYKFGSIDLGYIADKLDQDQEQVKREILNERIGFVNPTTGGVEVRYEYLSGNVREKLELAKANNAEGEYATNIEELEKVIPMDIPAHLIEFSLGSSWIDPQLYQQFLSDEFGITDSRVEHVEGAWIMNLYAGKSAEKNRQAGVYSEMFDVTIYGDELVGAALNNRAFAVKRIIKNSDGSTETLTDKDATQACTMRIAEIKDSFKEWARGKMQQDEVLAEKMMRTYNDKFNAIVPKSIDDMFLPERFGGAAESVSLYPHQKKSVIRGTTEPLMLAHEVGTGKTFTLISTAMEMRRIGTAKKPMIVVQNATVGQFVSEAKKLYPNANILTLSERDRTPEGRRVFYGKIKYSDWDMIVVPQSTFEMIPDSPERQMTFIRERIDDKMHALEAMREAGADEQVIKGMEKELDDLEIEFATVASGESATRQDAKGKAKAADNASVKAREQLDRRTDDVQYFDEMGVDAILVDEAHEYKRLGFATMMTRGVKGIDPAGSKKAAGVYLKTRVVLEQNGWKNVVFATGTPISNTAAELWTFMKYLMPKEVMMSNEIYYFDDFVRNFGKISQSLEFATNGKFKENTRFAAYINKPELVRLWASVSDTVLTKEVDYVNDKVPEMESGKAQDVFLPQSDGLIDIMRAVRKRLDEFERMSGKEKRANSSIPLTMYGIAKRAAIDTRLVNRDALDDPNSKTNKAVEETLRSLKETDSYKGTVAIFCDNQRRWDGKVVGFDLFGDMKRKLVEKGVPQEQIVIMKSGMSIAQKEKIFADVNAGNVRVIIGNTQTLGTGVNIQERLHTLVHMDAPDRPMDYTQRNGRILRQGNLHRPWNKTVRVLRFGVEDSLDVTSYQRLKTKAGFIDSIMDGKGALANNQENRTLEEEEEGLFDNPVAVLSGSQYALLKNQAEREYRKYANKKAQYEADQIYITNRLRRNEGKIKANLGLIEERREQVERLDRLFPDGIVHEVKIAGKVCRTDAEIDSTLRELVNKPIGEKAEAARKNTNYRGEKVVVKLSLDGVGVDAHVRISRESVYDNKVNSFRVVMHKDVSYSCEALGLENVPVSGGYVRNALDDLLENVVSGRDARESMDALVGANAKMMEENGLMKERNGKPFGYEKELKAAGEKVREYTELMRKEMEEKEAKYAERGSVSEVELAETEEEELRFRDREEEFNTQFNEELQQQIDGVLPSGHIYQLGNPSEILISAGFLDLPIELSADRLAKKASTEYESNHPFNIESIMDLPEALNSPIAVFDARRKNNAKVVLTELHDSGNNFVVAMQVRKSDDSRKLEIEVNDIRSIYPKDRKNGILDWINSGLLRWVDKKKASNFLSTQWPNYIASGKETGSSHVISSDILSTQWPNYIGGGKEVEHAAKIIESFENPIISEEENDAYVGEPGIWGYNSPYDVRKQRKAVLEEKQVREEEGLPLTRDNVAQEIYRMSGEYMRALYKNGELGRVRIGEYAEINRDKAIQEYNHAKSLLVPYKKALQDMKNRATDAARAVLDDQIANVDYALWYYKELSEGKDVWRTENSPRFRFANMGQLLQQGSEFFEKETIARVAEKLADSLHTPIRVVRDVNEITDDNPVKQKRMRRSSGWYNTGTGEVVIVLPNAISAADVQATILHEVVGHKGLRQLVGDEQFDSFLDKVYRNASPVVREKIATLAAKRGWDFPLATEEYLAGLAERGFADREERGFWAKVWSAFMDMIHAAKIRLGIHINDNDLRYMLWRSYQLRNSSGIVQEAEHVDMMQKMRVGPFDNREAGDNLRFRDNESVDDVAQRFYDVGVSSTFLHNLDEAHHDYMRSVDVLQKAIEKETGEKIKDFENVYLFENHVSSINKIEFDYMMNKIVNPLVQTVGEIVAKGGNIRGQKMNLDDVEVYLNCVHGLERNTKFAMRDANLVLEQKKRELDDLMKDGAITQEAYDDEMVVAKETADKLYQKNRERDYSGLTGIFNPDGESEISNAELESMAKEYIEEFESMVDADLINELWNGVKVLNDFSLDKSYHCGIISKEQYNAVKEMFEHYVPLRGFAEETAEDVYDYITRESAPIEKVLKKAEGRNSRAADLLATMMNMGHSAIVTGNKNMVKQKLLNLALNHPTSLLSLSEQWYEEQSDDTYLPRFPEVNDEMPAEAQRKAIEDFDERMKKLEKEGKVKRVKGGLNLNLRVAQKWQENEHCVRVRRNGREFQVWVNGNPKAALAINGALNSDAILHEHEKMLGAVNRFVAKNVTALNPEFLFSNLQRDVLSSNVVTFVKEGREYTARFNKNLKNNISLVSIKGARSGKYDGIYRLYHRYNNEQLDMNVPRERLFAEFMSNGGETGYTHLWSIDDYGKRIKKALKGKGVTHHAGMAFDVLRDSIEFANRGVENACRFAAYQTSREMGKSILQSIADAKEVSVNFNRKGSGRMGNNLAKSMFMFLNPAIQGLMQYVGLSRRYPKRMLPLLGGFIGIGFVVPFINQIIASLCGDGDDDDKKAYYRLSEWTRRNHLCIGITDDFLKISLPPEVRAMYGLGEIASGWMTGNSEYENAGVAIVNQLGQLMPLDVVDMKALITPGESAAKTFFKGITPSSLSYLSNAYLLNEDFMGRKITNQETWNKYDPEWKRCTKGTSTWLIDASRWMNEQLGGNDYKRSRFDSSALNPSAVEYLITSYLGGMATFAVKCWKTGQAICGNEEMQDVKNVPILNRVYATVDNEYSKKKLVNDAFRYYESEFKITNKEVKGFEGDMNRDVFKNAERLDSLYQSGEYKRWEKFEEYRSGLNELKREKDEAEESGDKDAVKAIEEDIYLMKSELVDLLRMTEEK